MVATTKKKKVDAPAASSISHEDLAKEDFEETPFWVSLVTMLGYGILFVVGHMRDFLRRNRFESSKVLYVLYAHVHSTSAHPHAQGSRYLLTGSPTVARFCFGGAVQR